MCTLLLHAFYEITLSVRWLYDSREGAREKGKTCTTTILFPSCIRPAFSLRTGMVRLIFTDNGKAPPIVRREQRMGRRWVVLRLPYAPIIKNATTKPQSLNHSLLFAHNSKQAIQSQDSHSKFVILLQQWTSAKPRSLLSLL